MWMLRSRGIVKSVLLVGLVLIALSPEVLAGLPPTLKQGASGSLVQQLQTILGILGLYRSPVDGVFGSETELAVRIFQHNCGLVVDGIVGGQTWERLLSYARSLDEHVYQLDSGETLWSVARRFDLAATELVRVNQVKDPTRLPVGFKVKLPKDLFLREATARDIQIIPWERVNHLFKVGEEAKITDLLTGLSLQVVRLGGSLHADIEPLTEHDTRQLREIYGGQWSWSRRAVIFELRGLKIAASINGFPHGNKRITNNFPGHFCIHFWGSKIHLSQRVDPDHQRMLLLAAGLDYF